MNNQQQQTGISDGNMDRVDGKGLALEGLLREWVRAGSASDETFVARVMHSIGQAEEANSVSRSRFARRLMQWTLPLAATVMVIFGWNQYQAVQSERGVRCQVVGGEKYSVNSEQYSVSKNQYIRPGDTIQTKADGFVKLAYADGSEIELQKNTTMALGAARGTRMLGLVKDCRGKWLKLDAGRLVAQVAKQPAGQPMVLATPQAMVTVVGTRFSLDADRDLTRLEVQEGVVRVENLVDQKTEDVRAGESVTAGAERTAISPVSPQTLDYQYTTTNGQVTITRYIGAGGEVVIPVTIRDMPVTVIGPTAFLDCKGLTRVTIPTGVTTIGRSAFSSCARLGNVTIPSGVTSIGHGAFAGCTNLNQVTIPSSITSLAMSLFYKCTRLSSVTIPATVTSIGDYAFSGCASLSSVTIPASVVSIGAGAFSGCTSLSNVTIPSGVTNIGQYAFLECANLTSVTIPTSVTSFATALFGNCIRLSNVTIPTSVTSIGSSAFNGCASLTGVTIPASVISIKGGAFGQCTSLGSVTIPATVASLDTAGLFANCTSLTNATLLPGNITTIGGDMFNNCTKLKSFAIPGGVTRIGDHAFMNCTSLTRVTIPGGVTRIGDQGFHTCTSLTGIYFEGKPPSPGNTMFEADNNLKVYYLAGKNGWGSTYGGRPTALWDQTTELSRTR